jgi:hypothetical protein
MGTSSIRLARMMAAWSQMRSTSLCKKDAKSLAGTEGAQPVVPEPDIDLRYLNSELSQQQAVGYLTGRECAGAASIDCRPTWSRAATDRRAYVHAGRPCGRVGGHGGRSPSITWVLDGETGSGRAGRMDIRVASCSSIA